MCAGLLVAELPTLVPELVSLVRAHGSDEVKGHALSALVTMVMHHRVAVRECRMEGEGLKSVLSDLASSWSSDDHEVQKDFTLNPFYTTFPINAHHLTFLAQDELAAIKTLTDTCFPST